MPLPHPIVRVLIWAAVGVVVLDHAGQSAGAAGGPSLPFRRGAEQSQVEPLPPYPPRAAADLPRLLARAQH